MRGAVESRVDQERDREERRRHLHQNDRFLTEAKDVADSSSNYLERMVLDNTNKCRDEKFRYIPSACFTDRRYLQWG